MNRDVSLGSLSGNLQVTINCSRIEFIERHLYLYDDYDLKGKRVLNSNLEGRKWQSIKADSMYMYYFEFVCKQ
jgi:hypothetical protein